jgi:curli biogenesis system outer membrane secretion channel CsgG
MSRTSILSAFAVVIPTMVGCSNMQMGDAGAKTVATGSAGGATAQNANSKLERCDRSLGTLSISEDSTESWYGYMAQNYKINSTVPLLRLIVQQSNCFVIVERGRAMSKMTQERELNKSGEMREGSDFGKGKMVSADYTVSPSITFSERDTSKFGAFAVGMLGSVASLVAGSAKSQEASTMLILIDNRSGIQLAAAEGSAKNWDFGMLGALFSGSAAGASGYANTPEKKVLAAAFMDSYNQMVKAVRTYKAQDVAGGLGKGGNLKTN